MLYIFFLYLNTIYPTSLNLLHMLGLPTDTSTPLSISDQPLERFSLLSLAVFFVLNFVTNDCYGKKGRFKYSSFVSKGYHLFKKGNLLALFQVARVLVLFFIFMRLVVTIILSRNLVLFLCNYVNMWLIMRYFVIKSRWHWAFGKHLQARCIYCDLSYVTFLYFGNIEVLPTIEKQFISNSFRKYNPLVIMKSSNSSKVIEELRGGNSFKRGRIFQFIYVNSIPCSNSSSEL